MPKTADVVLNRALALTPLERASLIGRLIAGFSPESRVALDREWAREAESRIEASDRGQFKARSVQPVVRCELSVPILPAPK